MRKRQHQYKRKIKSLILVICEGQTERVYTEFLKRLYRLPIEIKTKVSGANINARLIKSYVQEFNLDKNDICRVFLMYDADVPSVVAKLEKINETIILTNPCVELWFLLHVKDYNKEVSSARVIESLMASHTSWASYEKGVLTQKQTTLLTQGMQAAIIRAKHLRKGANPYTNMYEFIEVLESEKNT